MKIAAAVLSVLLPALLLLSPEERCAAEEPANASETLSAAKEAVKSERYDLALDILLRGKKRFPESSDIRLTLGNLYFDKEIYALALEEFLAAEKTDGTNKEVLNKTALTYGHLGREKTALAYYERINLLYPEDKEAINDLAWMYFKTHQLSKGEEVLQAAISRFGVNRRFAMTLGTIYADLYDYENAKKFYILAIAEAEREKEFRFASVAYYNLSLLEKSFYRYDSALEMTLKSILAEDRAPGHLAKGELFEGRRNFPAAIAEYLRADILDTTPLSRLNLASLYRKFGFLPEALSHARDVAEKKDFSWMYYFGTSRSRFLMDLHEILADTYTGLANLESFRPDPDFAKSLFGTIRGLTYRIIGGYHRLQYRRHAADVARTYLEEKNHLNAWFTFSLAFEGNPPAALRYLARAREIETTITPEADRFYLLEEGKIRGESNLLSLAENRFLVPWERENIEEALCLLIPALSKRRRLDEADEAALRLFRLNPGALRQRGIRLPARIVVQGNLDPGSVRRIESYMRRAGIGSAAEKETASLKFPTYAANYPILTVTINPAGEADWTLSGAGTTSSGTATVPNPSSTGSAAEPRQAAEQAKGDTARIPPPAARHRSDIGSPHNLAALAREIADGVFGVNR